VNSISAELDSVWHRIFYHVWWPSPGNDPMYALNPTMNRVRSNYYEGNFTPHMFTNGSSSGSSVSAWVEDPNKYLNMVSPYSISFQGALSNDYYNFDIAFKSLVKTAENSDIRLFVATTLKTVVYPRAYNGLNEHHNVMIEQLLGDEGKPIKFLFNVDYNESFSWKFSDDWLKNTELRWNKDKLRIVAWIQDYKTKEILQVEEFSF